METNTLHHFYHVYADGLWQEPCEEHLSALRASELLGCLQPIQIGIVGNRENRLQVKEFFTAAKIGHHICAESELGWEQVTQNKLHDFAVNDGYVFYAHTKGASSQSLTASNWRRTMTQYAVLGWREAIRHLNEYHAVGCYWTGSFFGGTFWWTKLEHIRGLSKPNPTHRHGAESWIGEIPNARMLDLRSPDMRHCTIDEQIELILKDANQDTNANGRRTVPLWVHQRQ